MKKKRKARPVYANPMQAVIAQISFIEPDHRRMLKRAFDGALNDFIRGVECQDAWMSLADACNVGEQLCNLGICSDDDSRARIAGGHQVLGDVMQRFNDRKSWTLYAEEIEAMREALWLHDVQLGFCTLAEYGKAVQAVINRTKAARAGNLARGTVVYQMPEHTNG